MDDEGYEYWAEQVAIVAKAVCSIAFSLKRIADLLEAQNKYGEKGVDALTNAIERAARYQ